MNLTFSLNFSLSGEYCNWHRGKIGISTWGMGSTKKQSINKYIVQPTCPTLNQNIIYKEMWSEIPYVLETIEKKNTKSHVCDTTYKCYQKHINICVCACAKRSALVNQRNTRWMLPSILRLKSKKCAWDHFFTHHVQHTRAGRNCMDAWVVAQKVCKFSWQKIQNCSDCHC